MEKDELSGMSAEKIAKAVLSLAEGKKVKPLSTTGIQYKCFALLSKILPVKIVNGVIALIYT